MRPRSRPTGSRRQSTSWRRRWREAVACGRRRLVRASGVPRAAALDPSRRRRARQRARRVHVDAAAPLAGGAPARRRRRLGHARLADLPQRASRGYQSGREFDPEILDQLDLAARARRLDRASSAARRLGSRPTTSSPPRWLPSTPAAAPRSSRPPTAMPSSSRRPTSRSSSRCGASASWQRIGPAEVACVTASSPTR